MARLEIKVKGYSYVGHQGIAYSEARTETILWPRGRFVVKYTRLVEKP